MVSIHAPVWGAKPVFDVVYAAVFVSIHAPVWGAKFAFVVSGNGGGFNPRTRVGCEPSEAFNMPQVPVSIHAPVWGANNNNQQCDRHYCFNPRTRVGCESFCFCHAVKCFGFQSTHPCGVRTATRALAQIRWGFNPRTRVGCEFLATPQ